MRFLKADQIFDGRDFLPEAAVLVFDEKGHFKEVSDETAVEKNKVETFRGILSPGFVNSHCHLELSHLYQQIPEHTGLAEFAKAIILQRNKLPEEEIVSFIAQADKDMLGRGIVAVGDISNSAISFSEKSRSKLYYHTFVELIGLNPVAAEPVFMQGLNLLEALKKQGLKGSLAPHAPYSTSPDLIKKIARFDYENKQPLSIHNQESQEENNFLRGNKSAFEGLYEFLKLDLSWFKAPGCNSLESYSELLRPGKAILVHNRVTTQAELRMTASDDIYWCFCPNANLYIENSLPEAAFFKPYTQQLVIGTDSLASNYGLDLVGEMNTLLRHSPVFSLAELLRMVTFNGAAALGISDRYGQFLPEKNTGLNLISYDKSQIQFLKKIF